MNTKNHSLDGPIIEPELSQRLAIVGWVFAAIGVIAIVLPVAATVVAEALIAWMLTLWGVVGLWFAWEMRPAPEWRYAATAFGLTLLLGLTFALFPRVSIETLIIVMMLAFLMEGVVSILLGLRTSDRVSNWGWLVLSGACSLVVGFIILLGWPGTAAWTLGLLMGLNFLSTGVALIMLKNATHKAV